MIGKLDRLSPSILIPLNGALLGGALIMLLSMSSLDGMGQRALQVSEATPRLFLMVLLAVFAAGISLLRLELGILLLPITAAAVPFAVATNTSSTIVASLLLAAFLTILWIGRSLLAHDFILVGPAVALPLLAFTGAAVLATIAGDATRPALVQVAPTFIRTQLGGLAVFVLSAAVLLVVMNAVREMRWVRALTWVVLALGAVALIGYFVRSRQDLPGFSVGGLFSLWVVVLALGQAFFNRQIPSWGRVLLFALAGAWIYRRLVLETSWVSGWLPIWTALLVLCFVKSRILFLVFLVGSAVVGLMGYQEVYNLQVVGQESSGNFLRPELWARNFEVTREHLLLGMGPAGYAPYYMTYFPDAAMSSHSNYVDILAQTGILGSLCFLWFMIAMFATAMTVRGRWQSGFEAGFANSVLAGMVGVLVAMALGDWLLPFVYNQTIAGFRSSVFSWLLMGALGSMLKMKAD